jgi:hypothetical protein
MLKPSHLALGAAVAIVISACLPLQAQESGVVSDLKVRTAWTPSPKDHLSGTALGFGLNFAWDTAFGQAGIELGYYYKTGDDYFLPQGAAPNGLQAPDQANSGDARRNQLDGFSLRLSLQRKLTEAWDWQAGLMLGGTRFRHEYHGQAQSQNFFYPYLNTDVDPAVMVYPGSDTWLDTYSGVKVQGGISVSPYAGVSWNMTKRSSLEFNLMLLNYTAVEYVHRPGTSTNYDPLTRVSAHNSFPSDYFTKSTRYEPHLEFGYVFHF